MIDGANLHGAYCDDLNNGIHGAGGNDSDGVFEVLTAPAGGRYVELTLNNGPENRWLASGEVVFDGTPGSLNPSVPEPGSAALVLLALAGLRLTRRRRG